MKIRKIIYGFMAGGLALLSLLALAIPLAPPLPLCDGIPTAHIVLDKNGHLLRMGLSADQKYRIHIPLTAVSSQAIQATLLYEDKYFYTHCGLNPLAILRAACTWFGGGRRTGASTLTMQVARLRFGLPSGSWLSKIQQIWLALRLEYQYSKQDILQAYINLAPYGANIEGIEAASRIYFHKSAHNLTLQEAMALAIIPQNPGRRHPLTGPDFAAARIRLATIWAKHYDNPAALYGASAPLRIFGPAHIPFAAPHASAELLSAPKNSIIHSTLSLPLQTLLEDQIKRFTARGRAYGVNNAAAILVHAPSRTIHALVGSANFFDVHIHGQVDGTKAKRSPGSTLKPFIYALALDQGLIHPLSLLIDAPQSFAGYDPKNFDNGFRGPLSAQTALNSSRNLPAIILAQQLKNPDLYAFLQQADINLPQPRTHYGLSLVLGGAELTMRQLAALYATLYNNGLYAPLSLQKPKPNNPANLRPLLSKEAAFITLDMLKQNAMHITNRTHNLAIPYKTGTSNGFRDAWTAGLIGPYVLIVWIGNFDNSPNPLFVGASTAKPLFADIAHALASKISLYAPQSPENLPENLNLIRIPVCAATGDVNTSLCKDVTTTWFIPGLSPTRDSGVFREILLDKASGLRACIANPATTQKVVWQCWPSNLRQLFAQSGLHKPPLPDWLPQCRPTNPDVAGTPPHILSPKKGLIYYAQLTHQQKASIPLLASVTSSAKYVFWFVNDRLIGKSPATQALLWSATPGIYTLHCTDDLGRTTSRQVEIRATR